MNKHQGKAKPSNILPTSPQMHKRNAEPVISTYQPVQPKGKVWPKTAINERRIREKESQ
jgi:hypothetical protein